MQRGWLLLFLCIFLLAGCKSACSREIDTYRSKVEPTVSEWMSEADAVVVAIGSNDNDIVSKSLLNMVEMQRDATSIESPSCVPFSGANLNLWMQYRLDALMLMRDNRIDEAEIYLKKYINGRNEWLNQLDAAH